MTGGELLASVGPRGHVATVTAAGLVIHADARWRNGLSPAGVAVAVRLHQAGAGLPSHVVHDAGGLCEACEP